MLSILDGDCLAILPTLEPESFDAIITDPPYGINYSCANARDSGQKARKERVKAGLQSATILNDTAPFVWFLYSAYRVLKNGGSLHCFAHPRKTRLFEDCIEAAGFKLRSIIVWDKVTNGMGSLKDQYAPTYENILFATKGKYTFPGKRPKDVISIHRATCGLNVDNTYRTLDKIPHPNVKPLELMKELLKTVPLCGRILDPFAGSGSTLIAAHQMGMDAVGIELDPKYAQIARERIARECKETA